MVESDVGLTCAIVRAAGQLQGGGRIRSVARRVERLGPGAVEAILRSSPPYDIFNGDGRLALAPDRFRLHALDVRRAADRIAELSGIGDRDEVALAAILHDIGRPVLARLRIRLRRAASTAAGATRTERIAQERRELGIDHALVGGVLTRALGPSRPHRRVHRAPPHAPGRGRGRGAALRRHGRRPSRGLPCLRPRTWSESAEHCGLDEPAVRMVLYELPQGRDHVAVRPARVRSPRGSWTSSGASPRARSTSRSPRSSICPRAQSAATCTTCTASSAHWTALRRSSWRPSRAGFKTESLLRRFLSRVGHSSTQIDQQGRDRHPDRVDGDVDGRAGPAADEGLVELVRAGVGEGDADGDQQRPSDHSAERPPPECGEQRVAGDVARACGRSRPTTGDRRMTDCAEVEDHVHQQQWRDRSQQGAVASIHRADRPAR